MMKKTMKMNFKNLRKMENKKEGKHLLKRPVAKIAVMIICIIVDAASLFTLFSVSLNENEFLLAAVIIAISTGLVVFPVLLADWFASPPIRKKHITLTAFVTCGTAFLILFLLTFVVRWYGRSVLFDTSETDNSTTYYGDLPSVSSADGSAMTVSSYENGVAILLGALPLINTRPLFSPPPGGQEKVPYSYAPPAADRSQSKHFRDGGRHLTPPE